jgi:septal ring factor EnvC (AmiA/AmiB activator)
VSLLALRWRRGLRAVSLLAAVLALPAAADRGEDLERLREAISRSRERVAGYERRQRSLLEAVEALDIAAAELAREVRLARQHAERARAEHQAVEAEATEIERRLAVTQRAMSYRAVALYKSGELAGVRMLFSAGGVREFLARVSALRLLLERDAELLERHRAQTATLAAARERTLTAAEASEQAAGELRSRSADLAHERAAKKQLVARLHADRIRERVALVELEKAARALEETLANLRGSAPSASKPLSGPSFASLRHALSPPVDVPMARGFGRVIDEEFFTETFRKGVEYDAPRGTPVRAVADGHVRYAGWFRGFGRLVILDHGDEYFSVSGHLSEMAVAVGDRVNAGDLIGEVGDTGSLGGTQLYFEIRRGSDPLDPSEWLRQPDSG